MNSCSPGSRWVEQEERRRRKRTTASPPALPRREGAGARQGEVNGVKFGVDSVKVDSVKAEGVK